MRTIKRSQNGRRGTAVAQYHRRNLKLGDGVVHESAESSVEISDKSQKIPDFDFADDSATAIMIDFALDAIICDEVSIQVSICLKQRVAREIFSVFFSIIA